MTLSSSLAGLFSADRRLRSFRRRMNPSGKKRGRASRGKGDAPGELVLSSDDYLPEVVTVNQSSPGL